MKLLFPKQNYNVLLPVSTFIYLWEIYIYFQDRSAYPAAGKYVDRSWEYINRTQTREYGNWDWGRAIPRKGIHKWDFSCSAVCGKPSLFEFIDAVRSFFQPILPRCDASNSGISQSQSRPTLQPEEECRNIKGFKHREKVIKACDVPRQAVVKVFSALGCNQRESEKGNRTGRLSHFPF